MGLGKTLISFLEAHAKKRGAATLDIEVVNHRSDLMGMYKQMGFSECGTAPFVAPERTTRPCHFVLMRRPVS